jgi:hypothetical protein
MWVSVVNATLRPLYAVPIVQEARWAPGPVCVGVESLALTEILSPDRLACRELYTD